MKRPRIHRYPEAGLTLGLGLAVAVALFTVSSGTLRAQPLSSGSGAGTGTGGTGGAAGNSTGSGTESGTTSPLPGANNYIAPSRGGNLLNPDRPPRGGGSIPAGPGIGSGLPGDSSIPMGAMAGFDARVNNPDYAAVSEIHMRYARAIAAPGDRSLTLSRIASAATFNNQLQMADLALTDASTAAMEMPEGMVRDQRLISIVMALLNLGEAHLREGRTDISIPDATGAPAALPKVDRVELIRRARDVIRQAGQLAEKIGNPTYRSEYMYRVADGLAYDSQSIVNEFPRPEGDSGRDSAGLNKSYEGLPDQMLQEAASIAQRIDRPVWHDRGLVTVASAAAESRQFSRAKDISRRIPQPEVRTDALLKIAETQARRGDSKGATSTYQEAAQAVASIPLDDPRAVLAGVLIDNLISVGRFDDARASVILYPDPARRLVALGAIAESQGRRGAANAAIVWINRDIPARYRSQLYRRVSNGVVSGIENNRTRDLSNRSER